MEYTFEKVRNNLYQVRLNGEFVTYSKHKDSDKIDQKLFKAGYQSREDFINDCIKYPTR